MKITLIVPYFGSWPPWFYAFLLSCRYNPDVEWLFFTDCEIPSVKYDNVKFIPFTLQELSMSASNRLGFEVTLAHAYKICDLRPAFGEVFKEHLTHSDFWGHCDIDVIWGDIRKFITDDILNSYAIVSARKHHISGHFTLYRNTEKINRLYQLIEDYPDRLRATDNLWLDERGMTPIVRNLESRGIVDVYWPRFLLNFADPKTDRPSDLTGYTEGWLWNQGKLFDQTAGSAEIMYLHFMTWKNSLKHIDFDYPYEPDRFSISSTSILEKRG